MVGQKRFDEQAASVLGDALYPGSRDRKILNLLEELPSLDPFLVREQLRRHHIEPDLAYFNISESDLAEMRSFVTDEISSLASLSMDGGRGGNALRLVNKLLSHGADVDLGPLREVLRLTDAEYLDGVFAWRGFLYFKWVNSRVVPAVDRLKAAIKVVRPNTTPNAEVRQYLFEARIRLCLALDEAKLATERALTHYDTAYRSLVDRQNPGAFRSFLLDAPSQFMGIGQPLGALQHMLSFWRYRFPNAKAASVTPDELWDLFIDFENTMGTRPDDSAVFAV